MNTAVNKRFYDNSSLLKSIIKNSGIQDILDNRVENGVTDIAINRPKEIWIENSKGWSCIDAPDLTYERLEKFANAFAIFNSQEINFENPICSGVLPNGERGQVVLPPACEDGTIAISIRVPSSTRFTLDQYKNTGRLSNFKSNVESIKAHAINPNPNELDLLKPFERELLKFIEEERIDDFIKMAVEKELNIVLVGGTGSGKTTFTKAVVDCIPPSVRIFTIEDTPELDMPNHPNRVHLFYGRAGVTPKQLVKSCMRMKPTRVLLTELRGDETWDYLSLLNTGHRGSVTTVHANDCESAYFRIGGLIKQSEIGQTMSFDYIMNEVFTTLDVMMFFEGTFLKEISYNPVRKYKLLNGARYE
ncbi:P-type DNA transfer ATPase VirB11 [Acinetobacter baumannii]|uniref:P-type DNA transfer ATPase VirB11 n=2 Tax=Acinetobacter baumannii TaxID=470 RepID=UPI002340F13E|nr:P-type DNA transfer ATPase VirB11 [Acinetobacter baumannii]MDC4147462.1 P-type DNA transfer ATPase VirB11 [Acinetobacter baumannii]